MADEKLTAKKAITIPVLTAIGTGAFCVLYRVIFSFSLPFIANATLSLILSLSITMGLILLFARYT